MNHDVYIHYNKKDEKLSEALYHLFNQNNIRPWLKSKEMGEGDSVNKISDAITSSKCFLLIFSKNSKSTNSIITETDIAFSRDIPIIALNVDGTKMDGKFEFLFKNQTVIYSFPDAETQLELLVRKTSEIIGNGTPNVTVNPQAVKEFEKVDPERKGKIIKRVVAAAVIIAVILVLIYSFVIVPTGQHTTGDGAFTMNMTSVDVSPSGGGYEYTVHGESYNLPSDSASYFMNIRFFDDTDKMVYEINSTADEFKSGVICRCNLAQDNVTHIDFKLLDINRNVLSNESYAMS